MTLPAGRMRGDINGDGFIDENDINLLANHVNGSEILTDETQLLCADANGDGIINMNDRAVIQLVERNELYGRQTDILGNWTSNPNYQNEEGQFYVDIPCKGITTMSDVNISIGEPGFSAEVIADGKIRFWCVMCPINEVIAIVTFKSGSGSVVINSTLSPLSVEDGGTGVRTYEKLRVKTNQVAYVSARGVLTGSRFPVINLENEGFPDFKIEPGVILVVDFILNTQNFNSSKIHIEDYNKTYPIYLPDGNSATNGNSYIQRYNIYLLAYGEDGFTVINPSNYYVRTAKNVAVSSAGWVLGGIHPEYPYSYDIDMGDISDLYYADVNFDFEELLSGNYSPISTVLPKKVRIYAKEPPAEDITIPVIICTRMIE